jgi:purine-binding chemotaxis protein CheW
VAVLSPQLLLADQRVASLLSEVQGSEETVVAEAQQAVQRERFVVVQLGEERYGLPVAAVDEVVRRPESLTRLPKAPAYVQGVLNLRGRIVPVIDQRQRFSVEGAAGAGGRIVVVTLGALQAGFAVDGVSSILEVEAGDLLPAPDLAGDGDRLFDRAVERDGEVILLIDPKALLDRAEADLLRDLTATAS